ncbi:hypothetical protein EST38_g2727 [Candolleomyces aberdarensis]|uniref:deuterolysin n=1 Tax=Candolleomyces aberdarensis TaxID=2316362 RepID=A0A4Q2DRR0_9AGAR|nr:hypothetical protein EST38_g2727 [Candolleomyces aberdarensis]
MVPNPVNLFLSNAMVCSALLYSFVLSVASLAFGSPLEKRAEGLTVELSTSASSISSIEDLKVIATVTNTGTEPVRLLKYGTVLDDKLPTKSFVVSKDGQAVPFTGVKAFYSSDVDDSAFAKVEPGQSVSATHNFAALYDFASVGTGSFTITSLANFVKVGDTGRYFEGGRGYSRVADVTSNTLTIEITADVAKRELQPLEKRARISCSNTSRASFISSSYTEAKALASGGVSYINSRGASDSLYNAYWGANPTSRVISVLNAVANESSDSRILNCNDVYGACTRGVVAYTVIITSNIYYCDVFFSLVPSTSLCSGMTVASRNVRGGTTLHEITHAVSGTEDLTYGCAADQALLDPLKIINADSYNCFTTQVYQNTHC